MNRLKSISLNQQEEIIIQNLADDNIKVGLMEFNLNPTIVSIPDSFNKIGNFDLDVVAIENSSSQIVILDYDQPDQKIGVVATDLKHFIEALRPVETFFELCIDNEDLYDDLDLMKTISSKASVIAGSDEYKWFYDKFFEI